MAEKFYVINERTLFACALRAALRRRCVIVDISPHLSVLTGVLRRATAYLIRRAHVRWIDKSGPAVRHLTEYPASISMHNIFEETESWLRAHYKFGELDSKFPENAMALKHAICTYSADVHPQVLYLNQAMTAEDADSVSGTSQMTEGLHAAYFGTTVGNRTSGAVRMVGYALLNLVQSLAIGGMIVWRFMKLLSLSGSKTENYFLIVDYVDDPDDLDIYELVSENRRVGMVLRPGFGIRESNEDRISKWQFVDINSGALGPRQACRALSEAMISVFKIGFRFGFSEPQLFRRLLVQPYRKLVYRGFFNKHRPEHYWSRDSYSPEHILRRQELNRVGALSHGILHGFGGMTNRIPMFRYLSFDRFYVFGHLIPEKYFKDTWASDMEIVPIGSFKEKGIVFNLKQSNRPPAKNILVSMSFLARLNHPETVNIIRSLATEFPDYQVLLQVKSNFQQDAETQRFISAATADLDNVLFCDRSVYALLAEAEYIFSDPSTIIMECLQYGKPTFMIDVLEFHRACFYREFPELSVHTADEAVGKLRDLTDGRHVFDESRYRRLIHMEGPHPHQIIRSTFERAAATGGV